MAAGPEVVNLFGNWLGVMGDRQRNRRRVNKDMFVGFDFFGVIELIDTTQPPFPLAGPLKIHRACVRLAAGTVSIRHLAFPCADLRIKRHRMIAAFVVDGVGGSPCTRYLYIIKGDDERVVG